MEFRIESNALELKFKYGKREESLKKFAGSWERKLAIAFHVVRKATLNSEVYLRSIYKNSKRPPTGELMRHEIVAGNSTLNTAKHAPYRHKMRGTYAGTLISKHAPWVDMAYLKFKPVKLKMEQNANQRILEGRF